jgi:hypothetical protein
MLESFKRLFSKPAIERDLTEISDWAKRRNYGFKRVRGEDGFVIDGMLDGRPWRVEWGPPQRSYIEGHELRVRMELDLPSDLQMLLMSRPLMDALERQTFEEFTDNVQTQIGTKTPEEMRWLVMFPKVNLSTLKTLRLRFGAVASDAASGLAWIEGPLGNLLEAASNDDLLRGDPPFILMTLRGRTYMRMQLASPNAKDVSVALGLFETAVAQAMRIAEGSDRSEGWNSTANTAWQSYQPVDRADVPPPLPMPPKRR